MLPWVVYLRGEIFTCIVLHNESAQLIIADPYILLRSQSMTTLYLIYLNCPQILSEYMQWWQTARRSVKRRYIY